MFLVLGHLEMLVDVHFGTRVKTNANPNSHWQAHG